MIEIFLVILASYLIGAFPTAIIAGKLLKGIDIREHGSGNAGATNVFRVLGWKAGLIVLLIDIFKGFAPVWWLSRLMPADPGNTELIALFQILAGLAAICGHIWTVFAGFKGGKGVGTAAGVFLAMQPLPVLICLGVFVFVVSLTRYVSLGSMTAAGVLPFLLLIKMFVFKIPVALSVMILAFILAALIVIMHRENIKRLADGTENKLSFSPPKDAS
jgi:glycerol-3-phosphate acyltransferase PlsY